MKENDSWENQSKSEHVMVPLCCLDQYSYIICYIYEQDLLDGVCYPFKLSCIQASRRIYSRLRKIILYSQITILQPLIIYIQYL